MVPVFRNVGERSAAKNYCSVSLLSIFSRVFEKPISNRIVDHLEMCSFFTDLQYGLSSSHSTTDPLTIVSDIIARAFNRSRQDRVLHAVLLHKLNSYRISGKVFGLTSSFFSYRRLQVLLDGKYSQEYSVSA